MELFSPPDREGCRWRIRVWPGGRVQVLPLSGESRAAYTVARPRTLHELGPWLVERGIDPERLEQI